jgi:hypothetical protein
MFGLTHKDETESPQREQYTNIDEVIETKIKACQRENGRCMVSTSRRLKEEFGIDEVNRVLRRLQRRRERGNKYQEKESNEILNLIAQLTNKKVNQEQFSL